MRIMKTEKKRSSLRFSPLFCPDLGEDQKKKKGLQSHLVSFSAQIFCPNSEKGWSWLNFSYYSEVFIHYRQPKSPLPNIPLIRPWVGAIIVIAQL